MPKLETFYIDDFDALQHSRVSQDSTPVFMHTKDNQGAFEFLDLRDVDASSKMSAKLAGVALLSGADFSGYISLKDNSGEIIVRHLA